MSDDFELEDDSCPECSHSPIRARPCHEIGCDDGFVDEHDDDPINFSPGEMVTPCLECHGTGHLRWCPKCGCDVTAHQISQLESSDD